MSSIIDVDFDEIVSIQKRGVEKVYDLTVDHPDHTFFANDISVSNCSHAVSYAIDSYYCAYLLTHYPNEWLVAYLEAMSSNPDDRSRAIGEVKSMGYEVVPIDVNDATREWRVLPGKKFMPSFLSCKGVGESAIEELIEMREHTGRFTSIHDMLYDENHQWVPSKFNKRALESLIKVNAFESVGCVGPGRLFESYRHMHHVLIENINSLKRATKKNPRDGYDNLQRIADETRESHKEEWTRKEQVENMVDVIGSIDVTRLMDPELLVQLAEREIHPIDSLEQGAEKQLVWFVAQGCTIKRTKNKKEYAQIEALSPSGRVRKLNVWGWKPSSKIEQYAVYLANGAERNEFGVSCTSWNLKRIGEDSDAD